MRERKRDKPTKTGSRNRTWEPSFTTLSIPKLRKALSYDPATGELHWKPGQQWLHSLRRKRDNDSSLATIHRGKFLGVSMYGLIVPAHWVAWAMTHGEFPGRMLYHVNGDGKDNRLSNLAVRIPARPKPKPRDSRQ